MELKPGSIRLLLRSGPILMARIRNLNWISARQQAVSIAIRGIIESSANCNGRCISVMIKKYRMNRIFLVSIILYLPICLWGQSEISYINRIHDNLKEIKSASYFWYQSASVLYDTIPSLSYKVFKKEFDNQDDKFVGACIASFQIEDTTKMVYFYDGKAQSYLDWENKTIPVDSFQFDRGPFRVIYPPFFTYVKSLLNYALETTDNRIVQVYDLADSVLIRLTFTDKLVEVVGNRIVYADPSHYREDKWTKYDIWISKANDLPFRMTIRFPYRVCWEECKEIKINTTDTVVFIASKYFPADFTVTINDNKQAKEKNLEGTVAPGWKLKDSENNEIALSDIKSKVLLIQFTGIGCGPCYQSIPYLVKIKDQFKPEEFDMVGIDTWNKNISVVKKYVSHNNINYKYLIDNNEAGLKYGIQSVPKFFVLDQNRVVRKIVTGFDKENTYSELKEAIDQLVNESSEDSVKVHVTKDNIYEDLRKQAFDITQQQLGLTIHDTEIYGVIMDWDIGNGIVTLVTYKTGDASMYLSSGGGVIGGGQHKNVNRAAKEFVRTAGKYFNNAIKIDSTPLPEKDGVRFYFLTAKGKYCAQEKMINFENESSKWLDFFNEANNVITELRKTVDRK